MKNRQVHKVYYRDKSDEFCPWCDSPTKVIGGYDSNPGYKYENRQCLCCKLTFRLILSF